MEEEEKHLLLKIFLAHVEASKYIWAFGGL